MMNFFQNILIISSVPLWIINSFGGIVSFIWLAILGNYWFLLGLGIAAMFLSSYAFAIAMLPSTGVQLLAMKMFEKKTEANWFDPDVHFNNFIDRCFCILGVFYLSNGIN